MKAIRKTLRNGGWGEVGARARGTKVDLPGIEVAELARIGKALGRLKV